MGKYFIDLRFGAAFTLFSLLFFAPSYSNYFVCDDFQFLGRIDFSNAGSYFTKSWGYGNEYRPLLPFTYAFDAFVSGEHPIGYHITNTLLHTAISLLIAMLSLGMGLSRGTAFIAALVFLLNPVAHESVVWISGRPVVLVVFLMLSACLAFLYAIERRRVHSWVACYALFLAALGTYELAIVTPLIAGFVALVSGKRSFLRVADAKHLLILAAIAGVYGAFWLWFFDFRFTRIHIERSVLEIASNFFQAIAHSFHGSLRLVVLPFYILLLISLGRRSAGRRIILLSLGWFILCYLPYFAVQGFADRFVYLSSAATAVLLAEAIRTVAPNSARIRVVVSLIVLSYLATGMQNRITAWREAGEIARAIPQDVKRELPTFPQDRDVILLNVPLMHKRSYVFLTSLDRALEREYPGSLIKFSTILTPTVSENAVILEYSAGRMVRRSRSELMPLSEP